MQVTIDLRFGQLEVTATFEDGAHAAYRISVDPADVSFSKAAVERVQEEWDEELQYYYTGEQQ